MEEGEEEQLRFCMEPAEPADFLFNGAPARSEPSILLPVTGEAEFTIIVSVELSRPLLQHQIFTE